MLILSLIGILEPSTLTLLSFIRTNHFFSNDRQLQPLAANHGSRDRQRSSWTVHFGSYHRPNWVKTVHFHPIGPFTLNLTRHTKSAVLLSIDLFFFIVSYLFQSKMQRKLFKEVTWMLRLNILIVYYLKFSRDRRTPISAFLKRLSS